MSNTANPSLLASLRLSKAMMLARRGKWREAEVAITNGNTEFTDAYTLEAVAALVTSEGDYVRALKLWEQLQRLDPDNTEARRMVPAIELWLTRPGWAPYFPYIVGTLAAAVLAIFLYITLSGPAYVPIHHPAAVSSANPVENGGALNASSAANSPKVEPVAAPTPIPIVSFPTAATPAKKHTTH